jgi:membrane peptidoglycan carboxypeptidase
MFTVLRRKRSSDKDTLGRLGKLVVGIASGLLLVLLGIGFLAGLFYFRIVEDLPPITQIQTTYGETLDRLPPPNHVFDRTGNRMLFALLHPDAEGREWITLGENITSANAPDLVNALIANQDPSYWSHSGFNLWTLVGSLAEALRGTEDIQRSIPQRLAEMTLLPAEDFMRHEITRLLRSAVLAQALNTQYSKSQILEMYINTVNYGTLAPGIDAAAMQFFGVRARDLDLAQSAILAAMVDYPDLDPGDRVRAKELQGLILATMVRAGTITEELFRQALSKSIALQPDAYHYSTGLMNVVGLEIREVLHPQAHHHTGLKIVTTIEGDLQDQVECTVEIHLDFLKGSSASAQDADVGLCEGEDYLPLVRETPGEEPGVNTASVVVLDQQNGELLSFYGNGNRSRNSGVMVDPFIYLTAFSKGHAPGTMVLDIPLQMDESERDTEFDGFGPVRMRTALVGAYFYAYDRAIQLVGEEAVYEVMERMGITEPQAALQARSDPEMEIGSSLLDLSFAYGILANEGTMTGRPSSTLLEPILIRSITDLEGREIYQYRTETQSILSSSLAYLMIDVLSDAAARWPYFGPENIFELDRPAAVMVDPHPAAGSEVWTIGFTTNRVVGVWLGAQPGKKLLGVGPLNGSSPLWHALMRSAAVGLTTRGWEIPDKVTFLDVCDPSGQLPTIYCPTTVSEPFLEGTEPTQIDQIYRPVSVNRETGKLATVFTPLDLIDEQIFFIPPTEALQWFTQNNFSLPPIEFDTLGDPVSGMDVGIESPSEYEYVQGRVRIQGKVDINNLERYRLEVGRGVFPKEWYLIEESTILSAGDLLGTWETAEFDGLMTLHLMVIDTDGRVKTFFRSVTVDNQAPVLGGIKVLQKDSEFEVFIQAFDNIGIDRVDIFIDNRKATSLEFSPYVANLEQSSDEMKDIFVRVYDLAGNMTESDVVEVGGG